MTEYLAAGHSAIAVERALARLGKEVAEDRSSAEMYGTLSKRLQPGSTVGTQGLHRTGADDLAVTSLWSAIPRSIYIQSSEPDRLYFRGIDGHLLNCLSKRSRKRCLRHDVCLLRAEHDEHRTPRFAGEIRGTTTDVVGDPVQP